MPLSNSDIIEIKKLLSYIPIDELFELSKTVTKNQIQIQNADEATKAIISFSQNPIQLLKRRKLKRKYLLIYLFNNGQSNISSDASKNDLLRQILKQWNSEFTENDIQMDEIDENDTNILLDIVGNNDTESSVTQYETVSAINNAGCIDEDRDGFNVWSSMNQIREIEEELWFGEKFCHWYFNMVNKHGDNAMDSIDASHFFPDCNLFLIHKRDLPTIELQTFRDIGASDVARRLDYIIKNQGIKFNPNLTRQGMRCFSDRFGRRMVVVCGSMQRGSEVVGIFEQQFVLVRDLESGNNWKVKFMRLAASTQVDQQPILDVTSKILTLS